MEAADETDVEAADEELNEAEEYQNWKAREFGRINNPKPPAAAPPKQKRKRKWRFMHKYYHKGSFFQSDLDADDHDFSSPTCEDRMDKTILPKVMQVKHFGRSGRTKWTHFLDQDTTHWNNPYYALNLKSLS